MHGRNPVKFYSPVLVLACGRIGFLRAGPLEILGYDTSEGLCTSAQVAGAGMQFGGDCEPVEDGWQRSTRVPLLWWGPVGRGGGGTPSQTNLAGYVDTDVARVEVRFPRQGRIWSKAETVAQVDGALLSKLRVSEPFGRLRRSSRDASHPRRSTSSRAARAGNSSDPSAANSRSGTFVIRPLLPRRPARDRLRLRLGRSQWSPLLVRPFVWCLPDGRRPGDHPIHPPLHATVSPTCTGDAKVKGTTATD